MLEWLCFVLYLLSTVVHCSVVLYVNCSVLYATSMIFILRVGNIKVLFLVSFEWN